MKRTILILTTCIAIALIGCRTNEANYRAAYEKAMERQTDTGDSLTTAQLRQSQMPQMMHIDNIQLPVLTTPIAPKVDAGDADAVRKYCVVVGRFKQIFNARSMMQRIASMGFDETFVVHDRTNYYYVVAASTASPAEAAKMLEEIKSRADLTLRSPFPYILRPAHLVR